MLHPAQQNVHDNGLTAARSARRNGRLCQGRPASAISRRNGESPSTGAGIAEPCAAQSFMPSNPWHRRHVHFAKRSGFADVVALGEVRAVPLQEVHRCGVPDKFGNRLLSKANGHLHDRFDDLLVICVPGEGRKPVMVELPEGQAAMLVPTAIQTGSG